MASGAAEIFIDLNRYAQVEPDLRCHITHFSNLCKIIKLKINEILCVLSYNLFQLSVELYCWYST